METLYALRDAFFWWVGVCATVTLGNRAINRFAERRVQRKARNHKEYQREFLVNIQQIHAEEAADSMEGREIHED